MIFADPRLVGAHSADSPTAQVRQMGRALRRAATPPATFDPTTEKSYPPIELFLLALRWNCSKAVLYTPAEKLCAIDAYGPGGIMWRRTKKQKPVVREITGSWSCPICGDAVPVSGVPMIEVSNHAARHVVERDLDQYYWECADPCPVAWLSDADVSLGTAAMALAHHWRIECGLTSY